MFKNVFLKNNAIAFPKNITFSYYFFLRFVILMPFTCVISGVKY